MSSRDYHLVTSNYGHHKTGYMGVCIAYPTRHFAAVDVELKRVGDHLDDALDADAPAEKRERRPPEAAGARKGAEAAPEGADDEGSGWLASVFKALRPFGARSDGDGGGGGGGGGGAKAQKRAAQHGSNSSPREVADIWDLSRKRFNVMINVKLQCLEGAAAPDGAGPPAAAAAGDHVFVVSNYHMPCVFWSPPVMVIHSSTAMQLALKFASRGSGGDGEGAVGTYPTVFAGDFNIKPHDAAYVLMTTGSIDADGDAYPAPAPASSPFGKRWTPTGGVLGEGMRSAYVVVRAPTGTGTESPRPALDHYYRPGAGRAPRLTRRRDRRRRPRAPRAAQATGREPDYTNNAIIRGQDQFTETLDYIFISEHWQVDAVRPLPARPAYAEAAGGAPAASPVVDIAGKPYPDDEQPSDHLMLAATLSL